MIEIKHPNLVHGTLQYEQFLGLEFLHGTQDCYGLVCRLFEHNLGIALTPYARPEDWWIHDMNLYMDNFAQEGFQLVDLQSLSQLHPFDCFLIALPDGRMPERAVTNHCGVYLGDGMMIHHRLGRLSQITPYKGMYRNFTTAIVRHKDVPDMTPREVGTVDLMDRMLPHKREILLGALNDRR